MLDTINSANFVLEQEITGLEALRESLNSSFHDAVELFANIQGRLIISGMGKSGHVARKIAATMASTGTPAYFVHPGEASHGDLGMVAPEDAVLLLSNSGETAELHDFISYCKRFSIPIVGMVRRKVSTLVQEADVALILPDTPEASPTGAPTTSTTMMMALGDCIAVALLEKRGFTREAFHVFHPGGKLGQAFTRVDKLMHSGDEVPLISPDALMSDALLIMTEKRFGCTGVVDNDKLVGIVTDGDLRRKMGKNLMEMRVRDVMTIDPTTTTPNALAAEALGVMNSKSITSLLVVDNTKRPVGIIHIHDCLRAGIQ